VAIVALVAGPVPFPSIAKEPEAWLILLAFLGGIAASARLGDRLHRLRHPTGIGSTNQEFDQQPAPGPLMSCGGVQIGSLSRHPNSWPDTSGVAAALT
jgi:hypothetical protein